MNADICFGHCGLCAELDWMLSSAADGAPRAQMRAAPSESRGVWLLVLAPGSPHGLHCISSEVRNALSSLLS